MSDITSVQFLGGISSHSVVAPAELDGLAARSVGGEIFLSRAALPLGTRPDVVTSLAPTQLKPAVGPPVVNAVVVSEGEDDVADIIDAVLFGVHNEG